VDEEYISRQLQSFSGSLKEFALRKRWAACGMKHLNISQISYLAADPSYFRFMKVDPDKYPKLHLDLYSTKVVRVLENCILYTPAVDLVKRKMSMCETCDTYFNSSFTKFPSWILANNLTLLPLPDGLKDIRDTEIQIVSPVLRTHNIATFSSGQTDKNTFLRSHVYTYGATPTLAISTMPLDMVELKAFNISIVGAYTTDIKALVANVYEIRPEKSLKLLALCMERKNPAILEKVSNSLMDDITMLASSKFFSSSYY
jgi:hypothetical protein